MGNFGIISSVDSLPIPEGPHVKDFDAAQKAAKIAVRDGKKAVPPSAVTRQMSPNRALLTVTPPTFQSVSDFVEAYKTTDKTIADLTGKFVEAADVAKQKQDEIVPHLAFMQSLLSKKGSNHHFVIEARKKGNKVPWWTDYYESYKDRLWESLRTMERRIDGYRKDPSVPPTGNGKGTDKPKHLTQLEYKLLGTATSVHEALTDINTGRFDDAVKKLKENLPTQDRIAEYLERGMNPTLAKPDGHAQAQADHSERQEGKAPIEPPLTLPASAPVAHTATFEDWQNHQLPAPEFKLKHFKEATENFTRNYTYSFQKSGFKKIIETLRDKPDQVLSNAQDFALLATILRAVAENANLLAAVIATALTPSAALESTSDPEEQQSEQNADQTDSDLNARSNEVGEPPKSEFESPTPAVKPDAGVVSTTKVGDKSEPTPHGFFFEMRLHEKLPYVVRDANNPNLGILCECKNKADAEMKVATYEREAAEAMAASLDDSDVPQVCEKDYSEDDVKKMFATEGD